MFSKNHDTQRCPNCDEVVSSADVNIKEGVALCSHCGKLSQLSTLNFSNKSIAETLERPPAGCSTDSMGRRTVATVSLRSFIGFVGTLAFALFWNGIVSVFVSLAIAGLYVNLIGPLPEWFPCLGIENGQPQMNDAPMGMGETLFLCLFLVPFVTVGTGMIIAMIMNLIGKVVVVIDEYDSYVATGIGFLRWKRRFDPRQLTGVDLSCSSWGQGNQSQQQVIELHADKSIKFGSMMSQSKKEWLRAWLLQLLLEREKSSKRDWQETASQLDLSWLK